MGFILMDQTDIINALIARVIINREKLKNALDVLANVS